MSDPRVGILTGTTASGKTQLALKLASERGGIEIVNADSMLVYRGMDIGTAKPTAEERARIPHHLIDIRDFDETFTAGDFVRAATSAITDIHARGKRALVVGGTGFYLKALTRGLWEGPPTNEEVRGRLENLDSEDLHEKLRARDSMSALRIGPADRYRLIRALEIIEVSGETPTELQARLELRPPLEQFVLWIVDRPSAELEQRIATRAQAMLEQGLLDEVSSLREKSPGARPLSAVGYAQICDYLDGRKPEGRTVRPGLPGLRDEIELATRQLVKRQRTWFRGQHDSPMLTMDRDREELIRRFDEVYG